MCLLRIKAELPPMLFPLLLPKISLCSAENFLSNRAERDLSLVLLKIRIRYDRLIEGGFPLLSKLKLWLTLPVSCRALSFPSIVVASWMLGPKSSKVCPWYSKNRVNFQSKWKLNPLRYYLTRGCFSRGVNFYCIPICLGRLILIYSQKILNSRLTPLKKLFMVE